jgi:nicotinate-nucleotide pyrophosphorylase (carboxylating)
MKITKSEIAILLKEDKASQDVTTNSIVVQNKLHNFKIISKNKTPFILCGTEAVSQAFESILAKYTITSLKKDGDTILPNHEVITGQASIKELLQIERTVLNLIQHLSGIATKTQTFVTALNNKNIKILDTRKTMPYLRRLQKYAVTIGGGHNHRMDLAQMAMIKDNHIIAANGSIKNAVRLIKKHQPSIKIEVECDTLTQVEEAITCPIDIILLDNMPLDDIKIATKIIREHSQIKIEVSGNVTLQNINQYQNCDIDFISIGYLTHSVEAVDVSMEVVI